MSTPISAADVNALRKRTDQPMMDCKSALVEAGGDMEKAVQILRERNSKVKDKRTGNETAEGRIAVFIDAGSKAAAILDMRCESAPTAKNSQFVTLANDLAKQIALKSPKTVEELLAQPYVGGKGTVSDRITEVIGLIRENMKPHRFTVLSGGQFGEYIHHDGSVGVLLQVEGKPGADPVVLRDLCAHFAAMNPQYIRTTDVPADIVAAEKKLAQQQIEADPKNAGKPANILEKIIEGKLRAWFGESVYLEQLVANQTKYEKKTVGQVLKAAGLEVVKVVRIKIGEVTL
jgi:elongation factor Ts